LKRSGREREKKNVTEQQRGSFSRSGLQSKSACLTTDNGFTTPSILKIKEERGIKQVHPDHSEAGLKPKNPQNKPTLKRRTIVVWGLRENILGSDRLYFVPVQLKKENCRVVILTTARNTVWRAGKLDRKNQNLSTVGSKGS